MDKLSEHAIRMLEIVDNERGFYKDMNGEVADIARAVYDLILQVQMLKMADRKVSEKSTGSNCSEKPNNCETCKHWWRSEDVCLLDDCQYEPTGDKLSSVAEVTTDCRQTKMTLDDAYYLVYKDLTKEDGLLTGKYDAKNGSKQYMNGVWSVMELIAYGVGIDCYEAFNERFCRNLEKSQEQTERSE